jgi:hypothetical protein
MKRNTLTLIALLGILLVVAYLVTQKPGEQSSSGLGTPLLTIDSASVDKIEIQSPKAHIVLAKQGPDWYLKEPIDYKADQASVTNLIHDTKTLNVKSVISDKPDKFHLFQVDSASGTMYTIYEKGTKNATLIVGKVGGSYTELYVRKLPSNNVDAVDMSISYLLNRDLKDWRNKVIITVPKETIKEIKYQYGDTTFTLAYQDSVWKIGTKEVKTGNVTPILGWLSNLVADDFIDSTLHPAPKISALISYNGNQLRFAYLKADKKYAVQSSSSPQWFVLESWKTNGILKRQKELVQSTK